MSTGFNSINIPQNTDNLVFYNQMAEIAKLNKEEEINNVLISSADQNGDGYAERLDFTGTEVSPEVLYSAFDLDSNGIVELEYYNEKIWSQNSSNYTDLYLSYDNETGKLIQQRKLSNGELVSDVNYEYNDTGVAQKETIKYNKNGKTERTVCQYERKETRPSLKEVYEDDERVEYTEYQYSKDWMRERQKDPKTGVGLNKEIITDIETGKPVYITEYEEDHFHIKVQRSYYYFESGSYEVHVDEGGDHEIDYIESYCAYDPSQSTITDKRTLKKKIKDFFGW